MEITKREIIASVTIVAALMIVGFIISGKISEAQMDKNEKYNKAVKIVDAEQFKYGMRTNVGNAFVYGDLEAVDTVSFPNIDGEYMSVTKVTEEYTRHTKWVNDYDEEGNYEGSHEEVYWTWDEVDREEKKCEKVSFLTVEFDSNKFNGIHEDYICTEQDVIFSDTRYEYYGSKTKYTGTIFTVLANNTISSSAFHKNKNIQETVEYLESEGTVLIVVFWILWILLICGSVYGFYYLDNNWLNRD